MAKLSTGVYSIERRTRLGSLAPTPIKQFVLKPAIALTTSPIATQPVATKQIQPPTVKVTQLRDQAVTTVATTSKTAIAPPSLPTSSSTVQQASASANLMPVMTFVPRPPPPAGPPATDPPPVPSIFFAPPMATQIPGPLPDSGAGQPVAPGTLPPPDYTNIVALGAGVAVGLAVLLFAR